MALAIFVQVTAWHQDCIAQLCPDAIECVAYRQHQRHAYLQLHQSQPLPDTAVSLAILKSWLPRRDLVAMMCTPHGPPSKSRSSSSSCQQQAQRFYLTTMELSRLRVLQLQAMVLRPKHQQARISLVWAKGQGRLRRQCYTHRGLQNNSNRTPAACLQHKAARLCLMTDTPRPCNVVRLLGYFASAPFISLFHSVRACYAAAKAWPACHCSIL